MKDILLKFLVLVCFSGCVCPGNSAPAAPLTNSDIIQMSKAHLSDQVIIQLIDKSSTGFDVSPKAIITLKQSGVSETVIASVISHSENHPDNSAAVTHPKAQTPRIRQPGYLGSDLIDAVRHGDAQSCASLIAKGADVNFQDAGNNTPLIWAASYGNYEIAAMLVQAGADAAVKDISGHTALDWAKTHDNSALVSLFTGGNESGEDYQRQQGAREHTQDDLIDWEQRARQHVHVEQTEPDPIHSTFSVSPGRFTYFQYPLAAGQTVALHVYVSSGGNRDINFYVLDYTRFIQLQGGVKPGARFSFDRCRWKQASHIAL